MPDWAAMTNGTSPNVLMIFVPQTVNLQLHMFVLFDIKMARSQFTVSAMNWSTLKVTYFRLCKLRLFYIKRDGVGGAGKCCCRMDFILI